MVRIHQKCNGDAKFQMSRRLDIRKPIKMTPVFHLLTGIEEVISQEPEVVDPKCGISNMNIPPNQILLVGVPVLKSKIFNQPALPWAQNQKKFCARVDPRV